MNPKPVFKTWAEARASHRQAYVVSESPARFLLCYDVVRSIKNSDRIVSIPFSYRVDVDDRGHPVNHRTDSWNSKHEVGPRTVTRQEIARRLSLARAQVRYSALHHEDIAALAARHHTAYARLKEYGIS